MADGGQEEVELQSTDETEIDIYYAPVPHPKTHTPSIAFRHLPLDSARFGFATEGALFISTQLSTDVVSALRKIWVLRL